MGTAKEEPRENDGEGLREKAETGDAVTAMQKRDGKVNPDDRRVNPRVVKLHTLHDPQEKISRLGEDLFRVGEADRLSGHGFSSTTAQKHKSSSVMSSSNMFRKKSAVGKAVLSTTGFIGGQTSRRLPPPSPSLLSERTRFATDFAQTLSY